MEDTKFLKIISIAFALVMFFVGYDLGRESSTRPTILTKGGKFEALICYNKAEDVWMICQPNTLYKENP